MHRAMFLLFACALTACGPKKGPPSPEQAAPTYTAEQCTAAGGEVVGDIGDGAIHRPEYRCAKSGEPPLGAIVSEAGQPVAVEGAVCCR
jgi:hypothetical protein